MIFIRYNRELESPLLNKPYVLCGPIVHPARMSSPILRSENGLDLFSASLKAAGKPFMHFISAAVLFVRQAIHQPHIIYQFKKIIKEV